MQQSTVVVVLGILIHSSIAQGQADPLKKWRELPAHKWQPFAVLYAEVGDAEKVEDGKRVKISKEERTNEALGECFIHLKAGSTGCPQPVRSGKPLRIGYPT